MDMQELARLGFYIEEKKRRRELDTPKPVPKVKRIRTVRVKTPGNNGGSMGRTPLPPDALRRSQLRVLAVLVDAEATSGSSAITVDQIIKVSGISYQSVKQGLGATRPEKREQHDKTYGYRSLITRGLVSVIDAGGEHRYCLSQMGQAKAEDLEDEIKAIKATPVNDAGLGKRTGEKAPKGPKIIRQKRQAKRTQQAIETVTE